MIEKVFFVEVEKLRLFTKTYTHNNISTNKPTLIFLHEGLGSVKQWNDFPKKVAEQTKLNAILYNRSSYSNSTFTNIERDYNYLHNYADELNSFIKQLNINKYILIGHSDGGTIALIHSGKNYSNHIASIIISGNTTNEYKIFNSITEVSKEFEKENSKLSISLCKLHNDNYKNVFYAWSNIWRSNIFKSWNILKEVNNIEIPILAFHGDNDKYTSLIQIESINTKSSIKKIIMSNTGHFPHVENAEYVTNEILEFVQSKLF